MHDLPPDARPLPHRGRRPVLPARRAGRDLGRCLAQGQLLPPRHRRVRPHAARVRHRMATTPPATPGSRGSQWDGTTSTAGLSMASRSTSTAWWRGTIACARPSIPRAVSWRRTRPTTLPSTATSSTPAPTIVTPLSGACNVPPPPDTTIVSGPANGAVIADTAPSFGFVSTDASSTFECRVDSGEFAACASPRHDREPRSRKSRLRRPRHRPCRLRRNAGHTLVHDRGPALPRHPLPRRIAPRPRRRSPAGRRENAQPHAQVPLSSQRTLHVRVQARQAWLGLMRVAEDLQPARTRRAQVQGQGHRSGRQHRTRTSQATVQDRREELELGPQPHHGHRPLRAIAGTAPGPGLGPTGPRCANPRSSRGVRAVGATGFERATFRPQPTRSALDPRPSSRSRRCCRWWSTCCYLAPELADPPPLLATVQVKLVPPKLSLTPSPVAWPALSWTKL